MLYADDMIHCSSINFVTNCRSEVLVDQSPLGDPWIKLNTDGSFCAILIDANCGGVLKDNSGYWLTDFVANLGNCCSTLAKQWGFFYDLRLATNTGYPHLLIELDSQ